jgi:hypothetical protein
MNEIHCKMCEYSWLSQHSQDGDFFCSDACWVAYLETLVPEESS